MVLLVVYGKAMSCWQAFCFAMLYLNDTSGDICQKLHCCRSLLVVYRHTSVDAQDCKISVLKSQNKRSHKMYSLCGWFFFCLSLVPESWGHNRQEGITLNRREVLPVSPNTLKRALQNTQLPECISSSSFVSFSKLKVWLQSGLGWHFPTLHINPVF